MCGLAGIVAFDGPPPSEQALAAMGESLRHRGPDAQGLIEDHSGQPAVGLVHRRLSIIDLSRVADQPIANEDGSVLAMLNGEIYNFRELRHDLEGRHRFRSNGDTEVLVHGYEDRGEAIVGALDGMFALAIWDGRRRRLVLARDRFGKKPIYYAWDSRRFVFGSEIKALFAAGVTPEMAPEGLPEYLALGYVPTPRTLFRGIHRLPPASILVIDAHGVHEPQTYWDLRFPPAGEATPVSFDDASRRVRELLEAAVRKRLAADVPLGVLLSGGVDSSAIAALVARQGSGKVRTFTVGFEGDQFDERAHAERVARHVGSEHHAALVRPDAASLIETLLHHHDEPFGDSSALPTYLVAREARSVVTVALNGDGGDETFAGYDRFHAALLAERFPAFARRGLATLSRLVPASRRRSLLHRAKRFAAHAGKSVEERLLSWAGFFDADTVGALLCDAPANVRDVLLPSYRGAIARCPGASLLSQMLYLNARTYLLDDLLPKMDRMTMAHGLEARSPMLDVDLVEYVAALPDAYKRQGASGKVVLKNAVADLLPSGIGSRPKQGFGVPLGEWFRGDLRPLVEDCLVSNPRLATRLRVGAVQRLWEQHLAGREDHGYELWGLLTLELWLRKHRFN